MSFNYMSGRYHINLNPRILIIFWLKFYLPWIIKERSKKIIKQISYIDPSQSEFSVDYNAIYGFFLSK